MKLVMLNGSPRGKKSNTRLLFEQMVEGMQSIDSNIEVEICYLREINKAEEHVASVEAADMILLGFPLYTDGMPGVTKHFIDALYPRDLHEKPVAFFVQSGFPESRHSEPVARYLAKLCQRLNGKHVGTIVRGGVEGIQIQPEAMTKKLFKQFYELGVSFAQAGEFDPEIIAKLAKPRKLNAASKLFLKTDASHMYWDMKLKENNAFERRFDQPYAEK